jgi:hypothetical protein
MESIGYDLCALPMPRLVKLLVTARRQLPGASQPQTFATPLDVGTEYSLVGASEDPGFVKIHVGSHIYVVEQENLAQATA